MTVKEFIEKLKTVSQESQIVLVKSVGDGYVQEFRNFSNPFLDYFQEIRVEIYDDCEENIKNEQCN